MSCREHATGSEITIGPAPTAALTGAAGGAILFGIYPRLLFEQARAAAASLGSAATSAALR